MSNGCFVFLVLSCGRLVKGLAPRVQQLPPPPYPCTAPVEFVLISISFFPFFIARCIREKNLIAGLWPWRAPLQDSITYNPILLYNLQKTKNTECSAAQMIARTLNFPTFLPLGFGLSFAQNPFQTRHGTNLVFKGSRRRRPNSFFLAIVISRRLFLLT